MQNRFEIAPKEERVIYDFLKDSPKRYSEIKRHYNKELKGENAPKFNSVLKRAERKGKIFRIPLSRKEVYYRLNDFPPDVKEVLAVCDTCIKNNEHSDFFRRFKENIIRFYPKLKLRDIYIDTQLEFEFQGEPHLSYMLKRKKEML